MLKPCSCHGPLYARAGRASGASIKEVVNLAVQLSLGSADRHHVIAAIDREDIKIPGRELLRNTAFKLNVMGMFWQRRKATFTS